MNLTGLSVRRPLATIIVFLSLTLLGGLSFYLLKLDLMPDLSVPMLTVITPYPGAGPREVETNVTKLLENGLSAVSGLDKITSSSEENISVISLSFDWDTSLSDATNDVRDKLDIASRNLPSDAEKPFLFKFDFSMMPILIFSVETTPEKFPSLQQFAEDNIVDQLKKINGVGQVQIMGGLKRQIQVDMDSARLEAMKISVETVQGIISASNLTIPGGKAKINHTSFQLRSPGEFTSIREIEQLVVGMNPRTGAAVRLSDVAKVKLSTNEQELFSETSTGVALMMIVNKQSNANTVDVAKRVLEKLEIIKKTLPDDIKINIIRDMSENIKNTIDNLANVVITGALFVIVVILLFLRSLRAGFIVGITIPTSLIVTFLFMYIKGYTLNMISLMGLSIAIGMVVDNGIVILENIVHHIEKGTNPAEAAVEGSSEVAGSIIASTLTTVIIFVPILYVSGIIGILFSQLAFVICATLIASLIVALVLVPTLSSLMVRKAKPWGIFKILYNSSEWAFLKLESGYLFLLKICLNNKLVSFSVIGGTAMLSLVLIPYMGTDYMPVTDNGFVEAAIELPSGTRPEETGKYVRELMARIEKEVPEKQAIIGSWGKSDDSAMAGSMGGAEYGDNMGRILISLINKGDRKRTDQEISDTFQEVATMFPGAKIKIAPNNMMSSLLMGGGKPIEIEIYGSNEEVSLNIARTIEDRLNNINGIVNVVVSQKDGLPEYSVETDRDKASRMGVSMYSIGRSVRNAFNGAKVSKFREEGKEYDILVRMRKSDRSSLKDLMRLKIPTMGGSFIELGNVAKIKQSVGPFKIERKNEERIIKVSGDIRGRDLGAVSEDVNTMLSSLKPPPEVTVKLSGEREEQMKSFRMLFIALIIGIILVYFVMAAQFESLRDPFIIITAIPFAMMGALWAFVMKGQTLSMLSFIGLIMLVGIVVNNGIVLIDYMKILRARGYSILDAVTEGGRSRLRPVLMTTITTIVGMIPLAMSTGQGSEMWVAMSTAVIGGLTVSTFVTLFLVPIMYTAMESGSERRAKARKEKKKRSKLSEITA
ncbi:MAG: efflux RND transporter permease subunit [Deltaproteobacteria bacterium]|nr:efflux RND transporter permease subunit [Deltaproteobacteria bacterium]